MNSGFRTGLSVTDHKYTEELIGIRNTKVDLE